MNAVKDHMLLATKVTSAEYIIATTFTACLRPRDRFKARNLGANLTSKYNITR